MDGHIKAHPSILYPFILDIENYQARGNPFYLKVIANLPPSYLPSSLPSFFTTAYILISDLQGNVKNNITATTMLSLYQDSQILTFCPIV